MANYAILAFVIAALLGLYMATKVLRNTPASWAVSILHALLGATGLVLLIVSYMLVESKGNQALLLPLIILIVTALGGFFLASFHLREKIPPKPVIIGHALAAIAGLGLLIVAVY